MRQFLSILLMIQIFFLGSFFFSSGAFAESGNTVTVSEKIPGATCKCVTRDKDDPGENGPICQGSIVYKRSYVCTVPQGLSGFQQVFAQLVRYVVQIALLLSVLAVVGLGIAWSFAGGDDIKAKTSLKNWAIMVLIGLTILFFFGAILRILAPWVYN